MIHIKKATIPIEVKISAGEIIKSIETGQLTNKDLLLGAIKVHISLIWNMSKMKEDMTFHDISQIKTIM